MGDRAISLKIKNEAVSVDFNLSDLSVIPEAPKMKHIPNFGTKIKIVQHLQSKHQWTTHDPLNLRRG